MKKILLLMVGVLMMANVAMADHLGFYADGSGASCSLASGNHFSGTTGCVVHKFATGATASRFSVQFPAGSGIFGFSTQYQANGNVTVDVSVAYGQCLSGSILVGCIVGSLTPGNGAVLPAQGFASILYANCDFTELPATGGLFYVDGSGPCGEVATEPSTWGQVKALYR
jgi:hypothetical protein